MKQRMRQWLSAPGLLHSMRQAFSRVKDPLAGRARQYHLTDCLMSGLAVFGLKCPSLLDFDEKRRDDVVCHNLKTLYGVQQAPCDTQLRKRLDDINPGLLKHAYKAGFRAAQRGKVLPLFECYDGHYLVSVDGTGIFHSNSVHCNHCCVKQHRDGTVSYYHQMLSSVLVHPDQPVVLPLWAEPISKADGSSKNDCERNASRRLLTDLRTLHPQLKLVVVEDALYANNPHIELLKSLDMRYLISVKPADHAWLFDWLKHCQCTPLTLPYGQAEVTLRWYQDVPLTSSEQHRVNVISCTQTYQGKTTHFTWITDIPVNRDNVYQLMRGARARWKIENETFNTLKNQGYHFEHNFGHGYQHLSTVLAYLMLLAFMIDQLQQLCCPFFQRALKACLKKKNLWEQMRHYFRNYFIECWEAFYQALVKRPQVYITWDTS